MSNQISIDRFSIRANKIVFVMIIASPESCTMQPHIYFLIDHDFIAIRRIALLYENLIFLTAVTNTANSTPEEVNGNSPSGTKTSNSCIHIRTAEKQQ